MAIPQTETEIPRDLLKQTSIVVCTVDRLPDLEACLTSLQIFKPEIAEIVVVNNGTLVAAVGEVAHRHGAKVIQEPQRGVSRARNAGIRAAGGSILAFLDDDSVADSNWLPLLLAPLRDPEVVVVSGSIAAQTLSDPVSNAFDCLLRTQFPESQTVLEWNAKSNSFPMRAALVGNANMAIRREAFERFGYFDTRFGRGSRIGSGEEPDLLLRILLGGARIVVEPAARIVHRHSTERSALRRWAFQSGCAHTAILTKHFLQERALRRQILRYAASRLRRPPAPKASSVVRATVPRAPFLLGSLCGPMAFLCSRRL